MVNEVNEPEVTIFAAEISETAWLAAVHLGHAAGLSLWDPQRLSELPDGREFAAAIQLAIAMADDAADRTPTPTDLFAGAQRGELEALIKFLNVSGPVEFRGNEDVGAVIDEHEPALPAGE